MRNLNCEKFRVDFKCEYIRTKRVGVTRFLQKIKKILRIVFEYPINSKNNFNH